MKCMQEKKGVDRKIRPSGLHCGITLDSDPRGGFFYLSLTPMIESYIT